MEGMGQPVAPEEFPPTEWTMLIHLTQEARRESLSLLVSAYCPPLKRYLRWRWRMDADRADDVLQGFLADKVFGKKLLASADRTRGKFRSYLLSALDHYVIDCFRREKHATEAGEWLDEAATPNAPASVYDAFQLDWARQTIRHALASMRGECLSKGRADVWEVFRCRIVEPVLNGAREVPYGDLIVRYRLQSPVSAFNLLVTGKRMFERNLRAVVGSYTRNTDDIDGELAELRTILSQSGAR